MSLLAVSVFLSESILTSIDGHFELFFGFLKNNYTYLETSYVHFSTCYGLQAASTFYDNGAKIFLSWDKKVNADIADENQLNMLKLMVGENYCAFDAYNNDTIVRSWWGWSTFKIYPDPSGSPIASNFYLPAWINLTVTGIPEGTSFIRAGVYDKDSNLLAQDDEEVSAGVTQVEMKEVGGLMLVPTEEVRVEARAFDSSNQELGAGQATTTLSAGANLSQVDLTSVKCSRYLLCGGESVQDRFWCNSDGLFIEIYINNEYCTKLNWNNAFFKYEGAAEAKTLRLKLCLDWSQPLRCQKEHGPVWLHCLDNQKKISLIEGKQYSSDCESTHQECPIDETFNLADIFD